MSVVFCIPCLDEAASIGRVVMALRDDWPDATILVGDNGSTDGTADVARGAGAEIVTEPRRGKGYMLGRLLHAARARVGTEGVVVCLDGDGQFALPDVRLVLHAARLFRGMGVGSRFQEGCPAAAIDRPRHWVPWMRRLGNAGMQVLVWVVLGRWLTDPLSGLRAFDAGCLRHLVVVSRGFEVEAELTARIIEMGYAICEVPIRVQPRLAGLSRTRAVRDGVRMAWATISTGLAYRPLTLAAGGTMACLALAPVAWLVHPLAALGCGVMALWALNVGVIAHAIVRRMRETEMALERNDA